MQRLAIWFKKPSKVRQWLDLKVSSGTSDSAKAVFPLERSLFWTTFHFNYTQEKTGNSWVIYMSLWLVHFPFYTCSTETFSTAHVLQSDQKSKKKINRYNFKHIFLEKKFSNFAAVITREQINESTSNLIGILSTCFDIQWTRIFSIRQQMSICNAINEHFFAKFELFF